MLINLRNALMTGRRLPYDAEVEYLESTGTQWIDTGLNYFADFEIGIKLRKSVPNKAIGTSVTMCLQRYSANNPYWSLNVNGTAYTSRVSIVDYHVMSWKGGVFAADGVTASTVSNPFASGTMTLFGAGGQYFPNMIYACKLWDANGVLVRDYIPVRKGAVGYLYDRVSGKLFGNAGTGDFVLGPDVVPVEYIESHGTEYIDTGVIGNSSTKVELKAQGTNTSALQVLCGARDSNGFYGFAVWQRSTLDGAYGVRWDYISTNKGSGSGYILDGIWNTAQPNLVVKDGANNYLNGVQLGANESNTFSCNFPLALFATNTGGSKGNFFVGKMFVCKIFNNNTPTRNYTPVRVGTDATSWEGAMMDVLTRRIYRNAGTGAFGYGNDLKYPIPAE